MNKTGHSLGLLLIAALTLAPAARADLNDGMNHFKSGNYMEAAAEFQALVDQSPSYDYGYYMMGLAFMQMKKSADAEKNLLEAIELNGEKFEYHYSLAKVYFDQGQYDKAVGVLKTAEPLATDDKTQGYLYTLRGLSLAEAEKWADAIDDLEKAKGAKPSAGVWTALGTAYYEMGHYDKALPCIREALKLTPNNVALQARMTNALLNMAAEATSDRQKDAYYKEALTSAKKFRDGRPNSADAQNMVGRAALGAGDFATAEQAFRKVLAMQSDQCWAMTNLGKTYNAQERWAEAEAVLKDAVECDPRSSAAYSTLGFSQQKQKKLEEALTTYEQAYKIKPSDSIMTAMNVCRENIEVRDHNRAMDEAAAAQKAAEEAEAARLAAEEAKRAEWEKKQRQRDD